MTCDMQARPHLFASGGLALGAGFGGLEIQALELVHAQASEAVLNQGGLGHPAQQARHGGGIDVETTKDDEQHLQSGEPLIQTRLR